MAQRGIVPRRRPLVLRVQQRETPFPKKLVSLFKIHGRMIFGLVWPFLLLPILYKAGEKKKIAYMYMLIFGYAAVECLPYLILALIPWVATTFLGITSTGFLQFVYGVQFYPEIVGSCIMAIAMEDTNLDKRLALFLITKFGCSHGKLLAILCIIFTSGSMFLPKTLISPIILVLVTAILRQFEEAGCIQAFINVRNNPLYPEGTFKPSKIAIGYFLCTTYCVTIGNSGTYLANTGNFYMCLHFKKHFQNHPRTLFKHWTKTSTPQMVINCFLTWIYCLVVFLGFLRPWSKEAKLIKLTKEEKRLKKKILKQRYKEMGKCTFRELCVFLAISFAFVCSVVREPHYQIGWFNIVKGIYETYTLTFPFPMILAGVSLLLIPRDINFIYSWHKDPEKRPTGPSPAVLAWSTMRIKLPYSFIFTIGLMRSLSTELTYWSDMIETTSKGLKTLYPFLPKKLFLFATLMLCGFYAEINEEHCLQVNFLGVMMHMSKELKIHPAYIVGASTVMCTYSFRFPFGSTQGIAAAVISRVPWRAFFVYGTIPAIYTAIVVTLVFPKSWNKYQYNIDEYPYHWRPPKGRNLTIY